MRRTNQIGTASARNESAETWSAAPLGGQGDVGHRNVAMSKKDVRKIEAGWASALPRRNRRAVLSRDVGVLARVTEQHWSGSANRGSDCHTPANIVRAGKTIKGDIILRGKTIYREQKKNLEKIFSPQQLPSVGAFPTPNQRSGRAKITV